MSKKSKIGVGIILLLVVIQFIQVDKINTKIIPSQDFISLEKPNGEIANVLKTSCYDCHSNTTKYPWYTSVAPISWWMKHHVNEGTEHLNFSLWAKYTTQQKEHKIEEAIEMIQKEEMPLNSYTWFYHKEAKLTKNQRTDLTKWLNSII